MERKEEAGSRSITQQRNMDSSETVKKGFSGKHLILDSTNECLCGVRGDCHRHSYIDPSPNRDGIIRYHGCRTKSDRVIKTHQSVAPAPFKPSEALIFQQKRLEKTHMRLLKNEELVNSHNHKVYSAYDQDTNFRPVYSQTIESRFYSPLGARDGQKESQETARFTDTDGENRSRAQAIKHQSIISVEEPCCEDDSQVEDEINFAQDRDKYDEVKTIQRECDKLEEILSGTLSRISTMQKYKQPLELDVASKRGIENRCMEKDAYLYRNGHTTITWESMQDASQLAAHKAELSFGSKDDNPSEIAHNYTAHAYQPFLTATDKDADTLVGLDSFLIKCRERHYKDAAEYDYSHWRSRGKQNQEYYGISRGRSPLKPIPERRSPVKRSISPNPNQSYHLNDGLKQVRRDHPIPNTNYSVNNEIKQASKYIRIEDDSNALNHSRPIRSQDKMQLTSYADSDLDYEELRRLQAEKLHLQSRVYKTRATLPYMDNILSRCKHLTDEIKDPSLYR